VKHRNGNDLERSAIPEVLAIYNELASRPPERNCTLRTECCQFKLTGRVPHLTRGEALVAARGWRSTGRKALIDRDDGSCPMLDEKTGRCFIYEQRPFGCRTHYCRAAGGPLDRRDVIDLIRRLESLDAALGGSGAHPLPMAVASLLVRLR
jgi:Fe-S-cluster containining protein